MSANDTNQRSRRDGLGAVAMRAVGYLLITAAAIALIVWAAWGQTPYGQTLYAPVFDEEVFRSINVGDDFATVEKLLGPPLRSYAVGSHVNVYYYTSPKSHRDNYYVRRGFGVDPVTQKVTDSFASVGWDYID